MKKFKEFDIINEARENTSSKRQDLDDFFLNYFDTSKAKSQLKQVGYRSPKSKIWKLISYRTTDVDLKKSLAVYEYKINIKGYLTVEKIQTIIKKIVNVLDIQILSYNLNQTMDSASESKNVTILRIYLNYLEQDLQKLTNFSEKIISQIKLPLGRGGLGLENMGYRKIYLHQWTPSFDYPREYKIEGGYFRFEKVFKGNFEKGLLTQKNAPTIFDYYDRIMEFAVTNFSKPTEIFIKSIHRGKYGESQKPMDAKKIVSNEIIQKFLKFEGLQEYLSNIEISCNNFQLPAYKTKGVAILFKNFVFYIDVYDFRMDFHIFFKPEFETKKISIKKES